MIYAGLLNFEFVAKFTVKNLNKDFINAVRGGHRFMKVFHKIPVFFERWLPLLAPQGALGGVVFLDRSIQAIQAKPIPR